MKRVLWVMVCAVLACSWANAQTDKSKYRNLSAFQAKELHRKMMSQRDVTAAQMCVVLEQVLPGELRVRGVANPEEVCTALLGALKSAPAADDEPDPESPEAVFRRLAGG